MTIKARSMRILLAIFAILTFVTIAQASDINWAGSYRFEGVLLDNPKLDASGTNKNYMLHHLVLKPKIVAADGVTIYSRFDLFNNAAYPDSQLGQFFGDGPNTTSATSGNLNVNSHNEKSE